MSSYKEMFKEETNGSCDESSKLIDFKLEVGETWFHQPIWSSTQMESESTSGLGDQAERMEELLTPSVLPCHVCKRRFVNRYSLLKHNIHHLEVKIWRVSMYQCDDCLIYFTKKNLLERHQIKTHLYNGDELKTTKMMYTCDICSKMYSYKPWHHHMSTVHSKKLEKCRLCDKIFKSSHYLRNHIKYVHKGYKPQWRFRTGPNSADFKIINCSTCNKEFTHPYSLKVHMKNVHPSEGSQECDVCGSILKSASYLRAHKQRVHFNDGKKHYCSVCGKDYKSPRYVRVHMRNVHKLCTETKEVRGGENYHKRKKTNLKKGKVKIKADSSKVAIKKKVGADKKTAREMILHDGRDESMIGGSAKEDIALNIFNECIKEKVLESNYAGEERVENAFFGVTYEKFKSDVNENLMLTLNVDENGCLKKETGEEYFEDAPVDSLQDVKVFVKEEVIMKTEDVQVSLFNKILDNYLQFESS